MQKDLFFNKKLLFKIILNNGNTIKNCVGILIRDSHNQNKNLLIENFIIMFKYSFNEILKQMLQNL